MNGEMSYPKYKKYIQSKEWKEKREAVLTRAGHKCATCPATTNLQVHHVTYRRLYNELPQDLRVLCKKCHYRVTMLDQKMGNGGSRIAQIKLDPTTRREMEERAVSSLTPKKEVPLVVRRRPKPTVEMI